MSSDVELIDCACYTQARRHPEVLGRVGRTVLPFQLTAAGLISGVGSFVVLVWSWAVWAWLLPSPIPVLVVLGVPTVLGRLAQVSMIEGRSPFQAAAGVLRYGFRARAGVVAGRPVRRGARQRVDGRLYVRGGR